MRRHRSGSMLKNLPAEWFVSAIGMAMTGDSAGLRSAISDEGESPSKWTLPLPSRLHPRPQPIDHPLRRRVACGDDEQPLQRRLIRIDGLVAKNLRIDQLLAGEIAVGVG